MTLPPPALPAREPWRTLAAAVTVLADRHWAAYDAWHRARRTDVYRVGLTSRMYHDTRWNERKAEQ